MLQKASASLAILKLPYVLWLSRLLPGLEALTGLRILDLGGCLLSSAEQQALFLSGCCPALESFTVGHDQRFLPVLQTTPAQVGAFAAARPTLKFFQLLQRVTSPAGDPDQIGITPDSNTMQEALLPAGLVLHVVPDRRKILQDLEAIDTWRAETEEGWCGVYYEAASTTLIPDNIVSNPGARRQAPEKARPTTSPEDTTDTAGSPPIPNGTTVTVHGLVSAKQYNGLSGTVTSWDPQKGRHEVKLLTSERKNLSLKPKNLDDSEPAAPPQSTGPADADAELCKPCVVSETQVVEIVGDAARLEFAQRHKLSLPDSSSPEEEGYESLEEMLDAWGIPCRWSREPPPGFTPYRRQKPGIVFFPSDPDAVFVLSTYTFGSVPNA